MNFQKLNSLIKPSKRLMSVCVVCLSIFVIYKVANSYWVHPPNKSERRFKNTLQRDINP